MINFSEETQKVFRKSGYVERSIFGFNRPLSEYIESLFFDEAKESPQPSVSRFGYKFSYKFDTVAYYHPRESIKKTPRNKLPDTFELGPVFGGTEGFFAVDTRILDIGSGGGKTVEEINEKYKGRSLRAIGFDVRYREIKPEDPSQGYYLAGEWQRMSFSDNSFDRILSMQSFPSWLPPNEEDINIIFKEVTRISKPGTIWRGGLPENPRNLDEYPIATPTIYDKVDIRTFFLKYGWEVYICDDAKAFAAKLVTKKV